MPSIQRFEVYNPHTGKGLGIVEGETEAEAMENFLSSVGIRALELHLSLSSDPIDPSELALESLGWVESGPED